MILCLKETTAKDVLMGTLDRLILMVTWISLDAFTEEQCWVRNNEHDDRHVLSYTCSRLKQYYIDMKYFAKGVCWKSLPGGGFLISKSWDFSDSSMIYLYPDCRTGLHGEFRNSDLVSGRQCELENFVTLVNNSIPVPVMSQPTGDVFSDDQATQEHFSRYTRLLKL